MNERFQNIHSKAGFNNSGQNSVYILAGVNLNQSIFEVQGLFQHVMAIVKCFTIFLKD